MISRPLPFFISQFLVERNLSFHFVAGSILSNAALWQATCCSTGIAHSRLELLAAWVKVLACLLFWLSGKYPYVRFCFGFQFFPSVSLLLYDIHDRICLESHRLLYLFHHYLSSF